MPDNPEPNESADLLAQAQSILAAAKEAVSTVTAASAAADESRKLAAAALAEAQQKLTDLTAATTAALASQTKITDLQTVIATKSEHIEDAKVHADKVRIDLETHLSNASQKASAAEAQRVAAQTAAEAAAATLATIRSTQGTVGADAAAIDTARKSAEESEKLLKGLANKAEAVNTTIAVYESDLNGLKKACQTQLEEINRLLPGATSVGLAKAFDERRKTFLAPHILWQVVFVLTIGMLVVVTGTALYAVITSGHVPKYEDLIPLWIIRLPVVAALVWLALHAAQEAALAKRLEEDYGYKAAVSASFVGFNEKLNEIGAASSTNSALGKLCEDTLKTVAAPPGRIYDKHKLVASPTDELKTVIKEVVVATLAAAKGQEPGTK